MSFSVFDVLTADRIELELQAGSQGEAISVLSALVASSPHMLDRSGFEKEVLEREKSNPTAVGNGVAFPHARSDCVGEIVMAAGRCREGIAFKDGEERVHLVFLIGTPKNMVREYLVLVGDLVRRVKQASVREALMQAASPAEYLAALRAAQRL